MPKDNTECLYYFIKPQVSHCLSSRLLHSVTSKERKTTYCKARKIGYVRAPNDTQIPSTLASSQTSEGGMYYTQD